MVKTITSGLETWSFMAQTKFFLIYQGGHSMVGGKNKSVMRKPMTFGKRIYMFQVGFEPR